MLNTFIYSYSIKMEANNEKARQSNLAADLLFHGG